MCSESTEFPDRLGCLCINPTNWQLMGICTAEHTHCDTSTLGCLGPCSPGADYFLSPCMCN